MALSARRKDNCIAHKSAWVECASLGKVAETIGKREGLVKTGIYPSMPSAASGGRKGCELVQNVLMSPHAKNWVQSKAWEGPEEFEGDNEEGVPFGGMLSFRIADLIRPSFLSSASDLLSPQFVPHTTRSPTRQLKGSSRPPRSSHSLNPSVESSYSLNSPR